MKKKSLFITSLLVLVNVWTVHAGVQGALPGVFSVSASKKVYFSQGNLQYQASTNTWRFVANQYTKGTDFLWGTGNNPTLNECCVSEYEEWGVNKITNGGNQTNIWRTLSKTEWTYIMTGRANAAQLVSKGTVNNVHGLIILPDNWSLPSGLTFIAGRTTDGWDVNDYSISDWQKMEQNGAIFLPVNVINGQFYTSSNVFFYTDLGLYWTSSPGAYSPNGSGMVFHRRSAYMQEDHGSRKNVKNVRLVIDSDKNVAYTITWKNWDGTTLATTSVLKGATPSYTGATPTRPSTAEYAYTFSGWTPTITAATANKTYTATYTATPRYTITFNANGGLIPTGGNMGNTPSGHITTLSTDRTSGTVVVTKDKTHFQTMTNDYPSRAGYTFAGWYTDPTSGVQVYDNTGYRVVGSYWNSEGKWIGTSNVTLYAHWTPIPYTITVNSSNVSQGSASGGGTYDYGTNHQISATSNECYRFVQWSDGNTDNPRTITVTGDATYTAEFEQIQYTIEALPDNPAQGSATVTNP